MHTRFHPGQADSCCQAVLNTRKSFLPPNAHVCRAQSAMCNSEGTLDSCPLQGTQKAAFGTMTCKGQPQWGLPRSVHHPPRLQAFMRRNFAACWIAACIDWRCLSICPQGIQTDIRNVCKAGPKPTRKGYHCPTPGWHTVSAAHI